MEKQTDEVFNTPLNQKEEQKHRDSTTISYPKSKEDFEHSEIGRTETKSTIIKPNRFKLILFSLILCILLSSMDSTIISIALADITKEFRTLDEVTWITTSYLLTSTALQPLYGKFSDLFGRKIILCSSILLFMAGSLGCGLTDQFITLILFRSLAGMGGGGLWALAVIVISDIVELNKRSLYLGLLGALYAMGSVVGPIVGGFITDYLGWRWIFFINLPISSVSLIIIILFLPPSVNSEVNSVSKWKRLDYLGTIFLTLAILLTVLGLNWGGNDYPWASLQVILSLSLGLVALVVFVLVEVKFAVEPIIPYSILTNNVISAISTAFLNGAIFFSIVNFTSIYYQVSKVESATNSGLELLPIVIGVTIFSLLSGYFINKTGSYRPLSRVGTLISLVGILLMGGLINPNLNNTLTIFFLLLIGIGIGCCIQTNIIICQASVAQKDVASVTSLVNFSQALGGIVGLTAVGAVYNNIIISYLKLHLPNSPYEIESLINTSDILKIQLDPFLLSTINDAYVEGYRHVYFTCITFALLSFISTLFLRHIPLSQSDYRENEITMLPIVIH